jgi:putative PEP-CTERM system TPR-repeat lipoprotein
MGVALIGQGQFPLALNELNKAIEYGYQVDEVRGKHALALIGSGRIQELINAYDAVTLQQAKAQAEVRTAVAVAHMSARRIDKAERALDEALQADPKFGWAIINKARIELHKGNRLAAEKLVDEAIASGTVNGEAWHFKGAMLYLLNADAAGAEHAFKESAKDSRYTALATSALASLYVANRKVNELRALHQDLVKSNPGLPGVLLIDAQIAYLEGRHKSARDSIDKLLRQRPTDARLLLFSGGIDLAMGSLLQAESQLGRAMQQPETAEVSRRLLALTYIRMGQPEKALSHIAPILESANVTSDDYALAGEANLQAGQLREAERLYTAAIKLSPDDVRFKSVVALIGLAKGQAVDALESLRSLAATDPGDLASKALISAHMRRREYDAALVVIEQLKNKGTSPAEVALHRGLVLRAKGDLVAARTAFEDVLRVVPTHYLAAAHLSEIDVRDGLPEQGRKRMQDIVSAHPRNGAARLTLANLLSSIEAKPAEVRAVLADAVATIGDDPRLRVALVTHDLKSIDPKSALIVAQQAVAAFPDNVDVLDALGRAQADSGNDQQAVSTFGRIIALTPSNPTPYIRLADVHGKRRNMAEAGRNLRKAFELAPDRREVHVRMLALAKHTKDPSLPLAAAKDLQRRYPDSLDGYFLEGDAYAGRGDWTRAIAAFRAALGKPDERSAAPIRVYDASWASGQQAAADRFVSEWLKTHPKDTRFLEHVGLLAIKRKNYPDAERLLKQAVELNPKSPAALNNLAWVQALTGSRTAVEIAERALALSPRSPEVMDTLASAWASQKNYDKAVEVQVRAVQASKGKAVFRLGLAKHLIAAGDHARAKVELDALVVLDPRLKDQESFVQLRKAVESK